ncbi:ABC transporter permease [Achromobacter insolitus]|uniref:ABC transporter permease n=1 Tax=Achromobacter TaxID=222 RepID=UPI000538B273|nr:MULTISPECIES: ABC transporter permease [Achromobacter]AVG41185.1 ABC transporter permease [Achromobacter insolitus]MCP1401369.1 peptide/nickel transport system permease protein [Achromobacter insolitus]MDH3062694.1 ABC transporter permease [Achromobacter insolitus]MEB3097782.1 ABC transporter permease [Achromobacter sp. D10]NGT13143.1 ABC transporter permease [Achromobacter insolitus]
MIHLIGKQLLLGFCVVITAITLTFFMVRLSGDPTTQILPQDATAEQRAALQRDLGLDQPVSTQYFRYILGAARGEFGHSYFDGDTVTAIIMRRLPNTALLAGASLAVALVLAIPLGVLAATRRGGLLDRSVQVVSVIGASVPSFWMALLMIQIFAVGLGWFPTYGIGSWQNLVLPTATLALYVFPGVARLTRSSMLEVLPAGYVSAARAKGMPERRVIFRTVMRNGIVPVLALIALEIGTLFGGAVLTETVFSWPGIGRLAIESIQRRDYPIIQGVVAYVAVIFALITVLVEIVIRMVNPRLRQQ